MYKELHPLIKVWLPSGCLRMLLTLKHIPSKLLLCYCIVVILILSIRFRPIHPKEVFDTIVGFTKKHNISLELVVDIGCGSGQSSLPLSNYCQQVVGIDISSEQIKNATINNTSAANVTYQVASADKLPFENESISMVTCGQAWHWLDPLVVNPEILRVLRKPGCLAIYGHTIPVIQKEPCAEIISEFYSQTLNGYWHSNRKLVDNRLDGVSLPIPLTERVDLEVHTQTSIDAYFGYIDTWSGYQSYLNDHPETEILKEMEEKIRKLLSSDVIDIVTSYFLLFCINT